MKKKLLICWLFIILLIILGFKITIGVESGKNNKNDWPKFRGHNGAGISEETGLLKSWLEGGPKEIWKIPIGVGYSSVAGSNGRIYTMDSQEANEFLVCLDESNGNEIWRYKVGPIYLDSSGNGPRSTPTINEELVFALSATGNLAAVNKKDGAEIWSVDINKEFGFRKPENWWGFSTSPLIENNLLLLEVGEKKIIQGYNGKIAWTINELQSQEAYEIQDQRTISYLELCADFDGALVDYQEKGHKVAYLGTDNIDGTDVHILIITLKSGKIENWYIEQSTYHLLKRTTELPHPYEPEQPDITQYLFFMDYKPINGILIPHYIEREDMQFVKEYVILEVELNPELDSNLFELYE